MFSPYLMLMLLGVVSFAAGFFTGRMVSDRKHERQALRRALSERIPPKGGRDA